jgi:hypothetical protein
LLAVKSWRDGVIGPHMKFQVSIDSAKACSLVLSNMSNMCPPTIVGSVQRLAKARARRMLSGSATTSSSSSIT